MEETKEKTRAPSTSTVFDDVFRTMVEKMPFLVILFVNVVFGEHHPLDAEIRLLPVVFTTLNGTRILDSLLQIGGKAYHIECQSTDDRTMPKRLFEYDALAAVRYARFDGRKCFMELPYSCVLYIREVKSVPDVLETEITSPDGCVFTYRVPAVKVSSFTWQELAEKKLFFLFPYYALRYEGRVTEVESKEFQAMVEEYREIHNCLDEELLRMGYGGIRGNFYGLMRKITDYIFRDNEDVRERIGAVMVGTVLELETEKAEAKGKAEGKVEGMDKVNRLYRAMAGDGRFAEFDESTQNPSYQEKLFAEYGIS